MNASELNRTDQPDLLAATTFAKVIPVTIVKAEKKKGLKKGEAGPEGCFRPVVLAEAPAEVIAMPEGDVEEKIAKTKAVLKWLMSRHDTAISYSGGKDSTCVLSIALAAARELKEAGREIKRFVILNANTGVENPEVNRVVMSELRNIRDWITRFDLPGEVHMTTPALLSTFAVSIIGGKSVISTPMTNSQCTTDLKSTPLNKRRAEVLGKNNVSKGAFTVNVSGMRFLESARRAGHMNARGESATQIVQTKADQSVAMAPIGNWETDEVMEYLGLGINGLLPFETYSNMEEVWRIYKDAEGECMIGRGDGAGGSKPPKGCSARHGCFICNMVSSDKSMDAMTAQERYAYMEPLSRFREFLDNTLFDMSRRTWVGRSIENGYIKFAPDAYAPHYLQELLRYALSIDANEAEAAQRLGIDPRFQIVSLEQLITIDCFWSLQGFAIPHTALKIYRDVYVRGERYVVPVVEKFPKVPIPAPRYIYVGKEWDDNAGDAFSGFRDPMLELVGEPCSETMVKEIKGVDRVVMKPRIEKSFSVDVESAALLLEFELDNLVDKYHGPNAKITAPSGIFAGQGFKFYVQYGTVAFSEGYINTVDNYLRRTAWRERLGLSGYNYDHDTAMLMSIEAIPPVVPPSEDELRKQAAEEAAAARKQRSRDIKNRTIGLRDLYEQWAPDVAWRELLRRKNGRSRMTGRLLPAYCINPKLSGRRKGFAIHHAIRLGYLTAFLKSNPAIAERVIAHRAPQFKKGMQLGLLTVLQPKKVKSARKQADPSALAIAA